jgi:hypothetical protein
MAGRLDRRAHRDLNQVRQHTHPDETWSDWTTAYSDREGSPITSPRARYLQWRAVLIAARGESPYLTSVTAAYLPRNLRPRVTSITIHPPGTVFQRPFPVDPEIAGFEGDLPDRRAAAAGQGISGSSPSLGRRTYQKGLLTIVWRAEDDNRDDLAYDVLYRREGETSWKPLKRAMSEAILVWDTSSVPNGRYFVRVVASDAPSNSPTTALTGAMESTSFDIDNTPPTISVTSVHREGRASSSPSMSAIRTPRCRRPTTRWMVIVGRRSTRRTVSRTPASNSLSSSWTEMRVRVE